MQEFFNGFNFIKPEARRRGQNHRTKGVSVRVHKNGHKSEASKVKNKSLTVTLGKEVLNTSGMAVGDTVIVGLKTENGKRYVFIRPAKNGERGYKISAPQRASTGHVKMTLRGDMHLYDNMDCSVDEVQYVFGGVLIND